MELPPSLFNGATPILVPVLVEEVLQNLANNPQKDSMPMLPAAQAPPRTETVFVRLCTFVPHFLAPLFLAEGRSPKAVLQLLVPVLVQQDLLLECKPLVDWLKVAVVQENGTYILGANPDPVLLAVDKVLMYHRMMLHRSDLSGCWVTTLPT